MAVYYWVAGNGTWDGTTTTNWSATSGGAGGAGVPTTADDAIINSASGGGTCTIGSNAVCRTANTTGSTTALAFGTNTISCHGSATSVWLGDTTYSVSGTPKVVLAYTGGTGTRTINSRTVTEANSISFDVIGGTDTVAFSVNNRYRNLNFTGFSGSWTLVAMLCYGDLTLSPNMTVGSNTTVLTFGATSGTKSITCSGKTIDCPITFNGAGGTWAFADNFASGATRTLTFTNGTLNASGNSVSIGNFALGSGTKTLTLGSGTWTVAGNWDSNTNVTNLTVSASVGTITMTGSSAKNFAGGAKSWPTLNQGGAGALTVQQSNTFVNITNTVQPATITFTSGTTQTVTDFDVSGTSGNLMTVNASTPGSQAILSDSTGTNTVAFVDLKDIAATGGATWEAYLADGNVDSGNNTGWVFTSSLASLAETPYELRSFTEKRRF